MRKMNIKNMLAKKYDTLENMVHYVYEKDGLVIAVAIWKKAKDEMNGYISALEDAGLIETITAKRTRDDFDKMLTDIIKKEEKK